MTDGTRSAATILLAGSLVLSLALGMRHTFGLFLQPVTMDVGWGRGTFALAIAVQNLAWGLAQPFFGIWADRAGARRVMLTGAALYAAGLAGMALLPGEAAFVLCAGVLVGLGLAGVTMPVVFGAISRTVPPEKRSMAFGISMAVGSAGQFVLLPAALVMIDGMGWQVTLILMAGLAAAMVPLALLMPRQGMARAAGDLTALPALRQALAHPGFLLLSFGFFVCGFQVVFIATHVPAHLQDGGLSAGVGAAVLALIGLFNIAGSLAAGWLGARYPKPRLLAAIYLGRGIAILAFVLLPLSPATAYAFAIAMGLLWLSTVPLTNGTVATIFGTANLSMLAGLVFLAHQIGSFAGGWLGGAIHDRSGSYDLAWGVALGLSLLAMLANLPIRERPAGQRAAA